MAQLSAAMVAFRREGGIGQARRGDISEMQVSRDFRSARLYSPACTVRGMPPTRSTYESNTDTCRYSIDLPAPDDSGDRHEAVCAHVLAYADKLSQGYIWHKQHSGISLDLSPASPAAAASAATVHHRHLQGSTNVTDAVDDEWLVVWILRQVSRNWPTAVIDVSDDDGEFLLIEAADHLPAWLTPQNAANRVWIHQGRLHLVPLEHKSPLPFAAARGQAPSADETLLNPSFDPDDDSFLDRAAAIHLVRDDKVDTLAPKEVEEAVWARIDGCVPSLLLLP